MPAPETFKLDIDGHAVEGTICLPETSSGKPVPCILLCRNLVDYNPTIDQLWDAFIDRALEKSHAVVSFEPRCSHLILDDFDAYSLDDYWRDADRVLYHISTKKSISADEVAVIGYGLGSLAALRLASTHAAIARIALVAPIFNARVVSGEEQLNVNGQADRAGLPRRMLESLEDFDATTMAKTCGATILLLHGAADRATPPEQSVEYERILTRIGLRARLELITRADHTFSHPETRHACSDRLVRFCVAG